MLFIKFFFVPLHFVTLKRVIKCCLSRLTVKPGGTFLWLLLSLN